MSRLIDADKLIKDIAKMLQPARPDETEMYKADDIFWSVEKLIKEQPTAYDVHKVIEEIDKDIQWHQFLKDNLKCNGTVITSDRDMYTLKQRILRKAIDIVKAGGIDE